MSHRSRLRKGATTAITTATALAAVGAVSVATGAIPSGSDGVINACYSSDGSLRVIDNEAGKTCNKGWTPLSWSRQGEPGPQGVPGKDGENGQDGAQGPTGERGPAGPAGSGAKIILARRTVTVPGARTAQCAPTFPPTPCFPLPHATDLTATVTCPDGTHGMPPGNATAVDDPNGGNPKVDVIDQRANGHDGWQATFRNGDAKLVDGSWEPIDHEARLELRCLEASVETVNVNN